ncbi:MAG: F0F1 ATP synthase subunit A [Myxococcales bacterium]
MKAASLAIVSLSLILCGTAFAQDGHEGHGHEGHDHAGHGHAEDPAAVDHPRSGQVGEERADPNLGAPSHAAGAAAGHGETAHHGPLSCAEILAPHEAHHSENVSDVIFHHVSDVHELEFESPVPVGGHAAAYHVNFKKILCNLTGGTGGWNGTIPVGGGYVDLTPTKHLFWMWVAALIAFLILARAAPKKGQLVPKGVGTMVELIVLFVRDEIAKKNIGDNYRRYTPFLLTCFFWILVMNLIGLVPWSGTATGNISVTAGLALITFIMTQYAGIRSAGLGGYLAHLTGGVPAPLWPIMIPVEILGLFTKPFALAIRLFANMVAGHIVIYFLIALIFILKTYALAPVSVAFAFGIYLLELFVSLVQAYVFTMLSALFIGMGEAMGHHHHGDHAHEQAGAAGGAHGEHAMHH